MLTRFREWSVLLVVRSFIGLSLLATMVSALRVYPHELAYFNELSGGPKNGSKHLLGSNLDWGQGLFELDRILDSHPDWGPIALFYSGSEFIPPESLGTRAIPQPADRFRAPLVGFSHVAVSENFLAGQSKWVDTTTGASPAGDQLVERLRDQSPVSV